MPFITEELYQRLPRSKEIAEKVPSITVASYPDVKECRWKNDVVESEVEFVQKVAKSIRSARSDYNLPNKTKTEGTIFGCLLIMLIAPREPFSLLKISC